MHYVTKPAILRNRTQHHLQHLAAHHLALFVEGECELPALALFTLKEALCELREVKFVRLRGIISHYHTMHNPPTIM